MYASKRHTINELEYWHQRALAESQLERIQKQENDQQSSTNLNISMQNQKGQQQIQQKNNNWWSDRTENTATNRTVNTRSSNVLNTPSDTLSITSNSPYNTTTKTKEQNQEQKKEKVPELSSSSYQQVSQTQPHQLQLAPQIQTAENTPQNSGGGLLDPLRQYWNQGGERIQTRKERRAAFMRRLSRNNSEDYYKDDDDPDEFNPLEPKQSSRTPPPPYDALKIDPGPLDPEQIMRQAEKLNEDHEAEGNIRGSMPGQEQNKTPTLTPLISQVSQNSAAKQGQKNIIFNPLPAIFPSLMVDRSIKDTQVDIVVHGEDGKTQKFKSG